KPPVAGGLVVMRRESVVYQLPVRPAVPSTPLPLGLYTCFVRCPFDKLWNRASTSRSENGG
ncbi:MAG: hypothetical protein LBS86_01415, partial [Treponema sp.]|nr:hypothetical protein [Treponema sp.]